MSKPLDRLALLETFIRIAERGSISAAARDLGLSQASASRHLKQLEERFGGELIRRTTHSLALTQAGRALLKDARGLTAGWDALLDRHADRGGALRGPIKAVAPVALGQSHLLNGAVEFQLAHPGVDLTWHLTDDAIRFAEIGCDCWIKVGGVPDETLVVRPLGTVERLLVAAPSLAGDSRYRQPEDLAALPFCALEPFEAGRVALHGPRRRSAELRPAVRLATDNIFALRRAALMGAGYAVLPRWFVQDDLEQGRLADLLPAWRAPRLPIDIAYLPAAHRPRRLTSFIEAISQTVAAITALEKPAA